MDRTKTRLCVVLALVLMLQSCAVYKTNPVSIEQAEKAHKRVLMVRSNGQKIKLKKVITEEGKYYGITTVHGQRTKILLDEKDIKTLRPIDRSATTIGNVSIVVLGVALIALAVYLSSPIMDLGSIDFGGP